MTTTSPTLARLKLVRELATVKTDLKAIGGSPVERLKLAGKANQVREALGAGTTSDTASQGRG